VGAVRNHGLQLCKTEYVALMDADDVSMPERLTTQLEYLSANPDCVMVGSQIDFLIGSAVQEGLPVETRSEEIERRLLVGGGVVYPTLMFRAGVARSVGGFRLQGAGEEYDFCLRMSEHGRVSNVPRVLYQYRLHGTSISMTKQTDLLRGAAYARRTAMQRRSGLPEMSFEEFDVLWRNRGMAEVLVERVKVLSNLSYRRGRISLAGRKRMRGLAQMALAASLDPVMATKHLYHIAAARLLGRTPPRRLALERAD
jgi:glycosyltransferase involved in cell wall biosynthesis